MISFACGLAASGVVIDWLIFGVYSLFHQYCQQVETEETLDCDESPHYIQMTCWAKQCVYELKRMAGRSRVIDQH